MLTLQIKKNNFVCHIPTTSNLNTKSNRFSVFQFRYIICYYMLYIPFGCASENIDHKPGMSHYIPCLIAE